MLHALEGSPRFDYRSLELGKLPGESKSSSHPSLFPIVRPSPSLAQFVQEASLDEGLLRLLPDAFPPPSPLSPFYFRPLPSLPPSAVITIIKGLLFLRSPSRSVVLSPRCVRAASVEGAFPSATLISSLLRGLGRIVFPEHPHLLRGPPHVTRTMHTVREGLISPTAPRATRLHRCGIALRSHVISCCQEPFLAFVLCPRVGRGLRRVGGIESTSWAGGVRRVAGDDPRFSV